MSIPETTHVPQDVEKLTRKQFAIKIAESAILLGDNLDVSKLSLSRVLTDKDVKAKKIPREIFKTQFVELRDMIDALTKPSSVSSEPAPATAEVAEASTESSAAPQAAEEQLLEEAKTSPSESTEATQSPIEEGQLVPGATSQDAAKEPEAKTRAQSPVRPNQSPRKNGGCKGHNLQSALQAAGVSTPPEEPMNEQENTAGSRPPLEEIDRKIKQMIRWRGRIEERGFKEKAIQEYGCDFRFNHDEAKREFRSNPQAFERRFDTIKAAHEELGLQKSLQDAEEIRDEVRLTPLPWLLEVLGYKRASTKEDRKKISDSVEVMRNAKAVDWEKKMLAEPENVTNLIRTLRGFKADRSTQPSSPLAGLNLGTLPKIQTGEAEQAAKSAAVAVEVTVTASQADDAAGSAQALPVVDVDATLLPPIPSEPETAPATAADEGATAEGESPSDITSKDEVKEPAAAAEKSALSKAESDLATLKGQYDQTIAELERFKEACVRQGLTPETWEAKYLEVMKDRGDLANVISRAKSTPATLVSDVAALHERIAQLEKQLADKPAAATAEELTKAKDALAAAQVEFKKLTGEHAKCALRISELEGNLAKAKEETTTAHSRAKHALDAAQRRIETAERAARDLERENQGLREQVRNRTEENDMFRRLFGPRAGQPAPQGAQPPVVPPPAPPAAQPGPGRNWRQVASRTAAVVAGLVGLALVLFMVYWGGQKLYRLAMRSSGGGASNTTAPATLTEVQRKAEKDLEEYEARRKAREALLEDTKPTNLAKEREEIEALDPEGEVKLPFPDIYKK